jgi:hypothetical protein
MRNTPNRMAKPSSRNLALTGLFAGMFSTTIGLAKCAPNMNNGTLGMPSLETPDRQVTDLDSERKTFFGRANAILEALKLGYEERVQVLTAEKTARCIEMRTEANTTCEVIQRNANGKDLANIIPSHREGYMLSDDSPPMDPHHIYPSESEEIPMTMQYDPAEVYCTSYNDQGFPQSIVAVYIGPVCDDSSYMKCEDEKYASIIAYDWVAARYLERGKASQAGEFITNFPSTFYSNFDWDSGKNASKVRSRPNHSFNNVSVIGTDSNLEALTTDYEYLCEDAAEGLDYPTPNSIVASNGYMDYLEAIDVLWDTFYPMDVLTPPEWSFYRFEDKRERGFSVPVLLDEQTGIDVTIKRQPNGEFTFTTSGQSHDATWSFCRRDVEMSELTEDPFLADELIDCELHGGPKYQVHDWFDHPISFW